jgi:hypothetical protein
VRFIKYTYIYVLKTKNSNLNASKYFTRKGDFVLFKINSKNKNKRNHKKKKKRMKERKKGRRKERKQVKKRKEKKKLWAKWSGLFGFCVGDFFYHFIDVYIKADRLYGKRIPIFLCKAHLNKIKNEFYHETIHITWYE